MRNLMSNSNNTVYILFNLAGRKLIKSISKFLIKLPDQYKYIIHFWVPEPIQLPAHIFDNIRVRSFFRIFKHHIPTGCLQIS